MNIKGLKEIIKNQCYDFFIFSRGENKETEKSTIINFYFLRVSSINTYSSMNWEENEKYKGFQGIYNCLISKKDFEIKIRESIKSILENLNLKTKNNKNIIINIKKI